MNKKGLSTIIALLIMILLTLMAVAIIWIVIDNLISSEFPQYKITKEVCENQEILIPDNLTLIGYTEEPFVSEFEVNISNPDFKVKYKFIGQVCETQEVDEIEIEEGYYCVNISENEITLYEIRYLPTYDEQMHDIYKTGKEMCEGSNLYWIKFPANINGVNVVINGDIISKKDLTKEWLKENCGCLDKPYGMSVCKWNVPDDCIIDRSITGLYTVNSSRPECLDCGQDYVFPEDCTLFKCGEYTVEVL